MKVLKATRLSNPHHRSNAKRTKRKMSPKQIRIFGTKRQKAALRAKRSANGQPAHRRRSSPNPLVVTLHPVTASNPHKRSNTVAKRAVSNKRRRVTVNSRRRATNRRRSVNPRRHRRRSNPRPVYVARRRTNVRHHRRRSNPTRIVVMAPRRQNRRRGSRNPLFMGSSLGSKSTLKIIGGGLVGVAAAKFIPQLIPASLTSSISTSSLGQMLITGVSAFVAGYVAGKLDPDFGTGVMFGGLMQTASVGLNAFLPNFQIAGVPIALGDLVQGQFAVPQNPLRGYQQRALPAATTTPSNMPAASGVKVTTSGLGRAYTAAY